MRSCRARYVLEGLVALDALVVTYSERGGVGYGYPVAFALEHFVEHCKKCRTSGYQLHTRVIAGQVRSDCVFRGLWWCIKFLWENITTKYGWPAAQFVSRTQIIFRERLDLLRESLLKPIDSLPLLCKTFLQLFDLKWLYCNR